MRSSATDGIKYHPLMFKEATSKSGQSRLWLMASSSTIQSLRLTASLHARQIAFLQWPLGHSGSFVQTVTTAFNAALLLLANGVELNSTLA